jgi:hypothetical protein
MGMPTSTTQPDNLIYFSEGRREVIIYLITIHKKLSPPQISNLWERHRFLCIIENKIRTDNINKRTLKKIQKEIEYAYEKFDDLFEMIKPKLLI